MDELQTIGPVVGVRLLAIDACAIDWASRWKLCTKIPRHRLVVPTPAYYTAASNAWSSPGLIYSLLPALQDYRVGGSIAQEVHQYGG